MRQGVTTEIIGHCGFSVAPALPGKVELLRDYLSPSAPWLPFRETTFPDYLAKFPATAVNAGMLVGHNTLRLMVMGMEKRPPTAAELARHDRAPGGGARGGRARAFLGPVHRARILCAAGRDDRALPRGQAPQCRLLHASARRIQQGAGGARGGDRDRGKMRRARRDRALQMLRHGQLGQGGARPRHDRATPRRAGSTSIAIPIPMPPAATRSRT